MKYLGYRSILWTHIPHTHPFFLAICNPRPLTSLLSAPCTVNTPTCQQFAKLVWDACTKENLLYWVRKRNTHTLRRHLNLIINIFLECKNIATVLFQKALEWMKQRLCYVIGLIGVCTAACSQESYWNADLFNLETCHFLKMGKTSLFFMHVNVVIVKQTDIHLKRLTNT